MASLLLKPMEAKREKQEEKKGKEVDRGHKPVNRGRPGEYPAARSPSNMVVGGAVASLRSRKHPGQKEKGKDDGMEEEREENVTHRNELVTSKHPRPIASSFSVPLLRLHNRNGKTK